MGQCNSQIQPGHPLLTDRCFKPSVKVGFQRYFLKRDERELLRTVANSRKSVQELLQSPKTRKVKSIWDKFNKIKEIGNSVFNHVYHVTDNETGEEYVLKQFKKSQLNSELFEHEYGIVNVFKHDHIMKCYGTYEDDEYWYLCLELCRGAMLFDRMQRLDHFSEKEVSEILKIILETISYMHSQNIVHRDIKPENIMYESDHPSSRLILVDFGNSMCVSTNETYTDIVGSSVYFAPEMSRARTGLEMKKMDMWAIGIVAHILLTGNSGFGGKSITELLSNVEKQNLLWDGICSPLSESAKDFVSSLLEKDSSKRLSANQALQHPWIQSIGATQDTDLGDDLRSKFSDYVQASSFKKEVLREIISDKHCQYKHELIWLLNQIDMNPNVSLDANNLAKYLQKRKQKKSQRKAKAKLNSKSHVHMSPYALSAMTITHTEQLRKLEQNSVFKTKSKAFLKSLPLNNGKIDWNNFESNQFNHVQNELKKIEMESNSNDPIVSKTIMI